ncbi:MAG: TolC family protein [Candidatus Manganitrophus sp. SB1]|nr:TolC family protein [Candidatus Manganitrophus morganii]
MTRPGPIRRLILIPAAALLALSGGCLQIDRWRLFDADLESHLRKETVRPITLPEEVQPVLAEPPPFTLPDAGPVDLSVEQAILLALHNNRDLKVRQINPIITGTFEQIERGVFDPELFAELTYGRERLSETDRATGTQFNVEGSERTAVAGIRQDLPTGTTFEAAVGQGRSSSDRTPEQQTARLGLSITQSLLRGFGPAVNLVSVRQAELDTLASLYELRGFTEALLSEAETAYWNYVLARQEIEIFERSLEVAQRQRQEVELRIEVGILPKIEAAAARAEVALREQALIDARSLVEETRLRLLRLINPGAERPLDLRVDATSDPAIDPEPIADLDDRLDLAERSRPDLNEARLRLTQNRLETIVTRNGLLPRLDFFIALGQTGFAGSFSDSFRELNGETYDVTAGVRLSHFLGNRTATALDRAARASRRQTAEAVDNLRQLVRLDVRLVANEVERARQQISATRATRILLEETLAAEEERFSVGSGTALLVAQAQRDLLAGSIAEVEAIVQYRIALVELYLAEGSLLERRGVRLPAAGQIQ